MSITRKRQPPYAKQFNPHDPGNQGIAFVYCGPNAWQSKDKLSNRSVILPPGDNPGDYDWTFLKDQMVVAYAMGGVSVEYMERIALYVLRGGAEFVDIITEPVHLVWNDQTWHDLTRNYERFYRTNKA